METADLPTPLPFRGGAVRLGAAQQDLVAAGWGLCQTRCASNGSPTPGPSPEGEGGDMT
jgi:hypothetical protein